MPYPSGELLPGEATLPSTGTTFTDGILSSMAPWLQSDVTGAHTDYLAALASMFEQVYGIVADQGSPDDPANYTAGWSNLLNVQTCPTAFLPFLATFVGVAVPPNTDDATARALIQAESGFARGTPAAIVATAQRFLTGSQSCSLVERSPGPYSFALIVKPEQLTNQAALIAAVNGVKPAGIVWQLVVTDSWTWNQAVHTWSADTFSWTQSNSTQP